MSNNSNWIIYYYIY